MTSVLDRVPVGQITAQAKEAHPGRVLLTLVAGLFFVIGWVTFKAFAVAWFVVVWCAVATREGWRESRKSKPARAVKQGG